jgi:hypothetical protein
MITFGSSVEDGKEISSGDDDLVLDFVIMMLMIGVF